MEQAKKRLTLDLDAALQRRLKVVAALMGTSMRQYCQKAIEKELRSDEQATVKSIPFGEEAVNRLAALQAETFKGRVLPDDSTGLIREVRARLVGRRHSPLHSAHPHLHGHTD
jgi:hypothetical protein